MNLILVMENVTRILKALSDPQRLRIIKMLELRSLCVCEITAVLHLATSTVSKHLSILRQAGLILDWKEGKWVNYRLNRSNDEFYFQEIMELISKQIDDDPMIVKDQVQVFQIDRNKICSK
jgi:ArsR family transcriptional regulator